MRILYLVLTVVIMTFSIASQCWSACEGDTNCDGVVDGLDVANLASTFGDTGCGTCDDVINELEQLKARIEYLELYHPDRFTDMGDGTIRDNNTGLFWMKFAGSCTRGGPPGIIWDSAMSNVVNIAEGDCGLTDGSTPGVWRLPTYEEFGELRNLDWASVGPALSDRRGTRAWQEGDAFSGVEEVFYWTSEPFSGFEAYVMNMDTGARPLRPQSELNLLWPVRDELP